VHAITFSYGDTGMVPVSYTVTDNLSIPQYSSYTAQPTGSYQLLYDQQGRLVSDSLVDTAGNCCGDLLYKWSYSGGNIGVYLMGQIGIALYDSIQVVNGNVHSYTWYGVTYGSARNPLYNPEIGGRFGAFFFVATRPKSVAWFSGPTDIISKNLPQSQADPNNDDEYLFRWRTGKNGWVTSGTIADTAGYFGPIAVSFTYQ
jgi:hypothetical protein